MALGRRFGFLVAWLGLHAVAQAQAQEQAQEPDPFTTRALIRRVGDLRPAVEDAIGDRLPARLDVRAVTRDELAGITRRRRNGGSGGRLADAYREEHLVSRSTSALALVLPATGELLVCGENFTRTAAERPEWRAIRSPDYLDIVLAHELAHEYQRARHGPSAFRARADSAEALAARFAVLEGHAQFIARRVAQARGLEEAFALHTETLTAPPVGMKDPATLYQWRLAQAELAFAYVQGEAFFEAVAKRLGRREALARLVREPPRTLATVSYPAEYFAPRESADRDFDREFDRAADLVLGLLRELEPEATGAPLPRDVLLAQIELIGAERAARSLEGFRRAFVVRDRSGSTLALVCLFDGREAALSFDEANRLLHERKAALFAEDDAVQRILASRVDARRLEGTLFRLQQTTAREQTTGEIRTLNAARFVWANLAVEISLRDWTSGKRRSVRFAQRVQEILRGVRIGPHWADLEPAEARAATLAAAADPHWGVRWRGARSLGRFRDDREKAESQLLALIGDPNPHVRLAAFESLHRLGARGAIPEMAAMDRDWEVREQYVTRIAGDPRLPREERIARLLEALADPHAAPRVEAFRRLTDLGAQDRIPWTSLRAAIGHPSPHVRAWALTALSLERLPPRGSEIPQAEVVPILLKASRDESARVRDRALRCLIHVSPDLPGVVDAQLAALRDDDIFVRMTGAYAAARLGPRAAPAADLLTAMLDDPLLATHAARALGHIGEHARPALARLRVLYDGEDMETRFAAGCALWRLGETPDGLVAVLRTTLRSGEDYDRDDAARILGRLGAKAAIPDLIEALRDEDAHVRRAAREAIKRLR